MNQGGELAAWRSEVTYPIKERSVPMNYVPCPKRVFPFKLASLLPSLYATYLHWLRHLLERLGHDCTLAIWQKGCQDYDDALVTQILTTGWNQAASDEVIAAEESIDKLFSRFFPVAIDGVGKDEARALVEEMPPIHQIRRTLPTLNVWKEATAYEVLHLRFGGLALLAETLIQFHGKQGELIVYDIHCEDRIKAVGGKTGSVAEFMSGFASKPDQASLATAGLEREIIHTSEREAVMHVKECEWARYFRERHPQIGYLMACSTDEVFYRTFNENLRMQRTSTLMEGGEICDFRIYATGEALDSK
jgi:hypothetical protein